MDNVLATAGIACLIAAVVGGGLKAFGLEIPALKSRPRQVLLAALGAGLLLASRNSALLPDLASRPPATVQPSAVAQASATPAATTALLAGKPDPAGPAATGQASQTTGSITPGGPPVAVTTSVPGQRFRVTFEGEAGRVVSLTQRDSTGQPGPSTRAGCLNESTSLLRPDGQELASTISCGLIEATRLPVGGTYTIEVGMLDSSTADLSLSLQDVSP